MENRIFGLLDHSQDKLGVSGRVRRTRYLILAGADAPVAPVLTAPLMRMDGAFQNTLLVL